MFWIIFGFCIEIGAIKIAGFVTNKFEEEHLSKRIKLSARY